MGVFSEMSMELQNGISSPFEEAGDFPQTPAFDLPDSLPVAAAGPGAEETQLPVPQTESLPAVDEADEVDDEQEECGDDCTDEPVTKESPAKDTAVKKAQADAEEERRRAEHEAAEARRKEEWESARNAKKEAEHSQLEKLAAMTDEEIMAASAERICGDTERLTRRNMKECVSEYIQTLCFSDPDFARLTMQPRKTMIHCFFYINRKAMEFLQQEMKDNGMKPEGPNGAYGGDVPDDLCYQWAEEYFRDPNAEEDKEKEEEFVPKPYVGRTGTAKTKGKKTQAKKEAEKNEPEKKPEPEAKKEVPDGQMSLLDLAMPASKAS